MAACSDNLVRSPVGDGTDNTAAVAKTLDAPQLLKATHGGIQKIELSWEGVKGARLYYIYAAQNVFADFEQIGEASGTDTSFEVTQASGQSRYFKIKAVNYSNVESSFSNVAFGSTLATPVITSIEQGSDGTNSTINWWMDNCSSSTYKANIMYEVTAFDQDKTNAVSSVTVSDGSLSATLTGLSPKTEYYYRVDAFLTGAQDKIESSDLLDAETARKLLPLSAVNFSAQKGQSSSAVLLNWQLPAYVDYLITTGVYERHPVYFKIWRKESTQSDSDFVELVSYIGCVKEGNATGSIINFDCTSGTTSSTALTVEPSTSEESEVSADYKYSSLSVLKYTDTTAQISKKYDYKIQSYVDDTTKTLTSESSCTQDQGWLICSPQLFVNSNYVKDTENSKFTSIEFSLALTFEPFQQEYTYIIQQTKTDLDGNNAETSLVIYDNIEEVNHYRVEFTDPAADEGYYTYSIFICPPGATGASDAITLASALGTQIVTSDASRIPVIDSFTVTDGFADKFIIQFAYNEAYTYTLTWMNETGGVLQPSESITLLNEELTVEEGIATYNHAAASGDCRFYTLTASNGLKTPADPNNAVQGVSFKTLGTAQINSNARYYDKIEFNWDAVQMADSTYQVTAYYTDDDTQTPLAINAEDIVEYAEGKYKCTVNQPAGFDNATISGKSVTVKVVSSNMATTDTTTAEAVCCTMGPACTNMAVTRQSETQLQIRWDGINGATGYLVGRAVYKDAQLNEIEKIDSYYISAETLTAQVQGEDIDDSYVAVSQSGSQIVLTDNYVYTENADSSLAAYCNNQAKICTGLPYRYFVVPLLAEGDFGFEINGALMKLTDDSQVVYSDVDGVVAATWGYGQDVEASKAQNSSIITVTWKQPYDGANKDPYIYYRKSDSGDGWSLAGSVVRSSQAKMSYSITPGENTRTQAYEFAVVYNKSAATVEPKQYILDVLAQKMASDSPSEQLNKGYLLSMQKPFANFIEGYTEQVNWVSYDYDNRALGPDYYEIQVKNMDDTNGWVKIAKVNIDLAADDFGKTAELSDTGTTKIELVKSGVNMIQIKPVFDGFDGGTTTGVLKVLRSPKHYYRIAGVRSYTKDDVTATVSCTAGEDLSVYAYRNFTDTEIARSALLTMTYGFYQEAGGSADYSNVGDKLLYDKDGGTITTSNGGTAVFEDIDFFTNSIDLGKYKASFSYNSFAPDMLTPSGETCNFLSIGIAESSIRLKGWSDSYPYNFRTDGGIDITTSLADSTLTGISADATVHFLCNEVGGTSLEVTVTRSGETKELCNVSGEVDTRRKWLPMMMVPEDSAYLIKNLTYGWWPDEN
ncbi:MAG: hypothetical protein K6B73_02375 [Treponema sp.]|nr:hypothetical protein [Treponema sp.]